MHTYVFVYVLLISQPTIEKVYTDRGIALSIFTISAIQGQETERESNAVKISVYAEMGAIQYKSQTNSL